MRYLHFMRALRKRFLYTFLVSMSGALTAQPPIQWQRSYGGSDVDRGTKVIPLMDEGYLVVGTSTSTDGDATGCMSSISRVWVLRLDSQGVLLWQRCYGGSGNQTLPYMTATSDGGFAIACRTNSTDGDISNPLGSTDIWVFKINLEGDLLWEQSVGGTMGEDCRGILEGNDGTLFVFGSTSSPELDGFHPQPFVNPGDLYLAKLSTGGELLEQRCFGSSEHEAPFAFSKSPNDQFLLVGSLGGVDGDVNITYPSSRWLVEVNQQLGITWQRGIIDSDGLSLTQAYKNPMGELYITGSNFYSVGEVVNLWGEQDMFAIKLGSNSQLLRSTAFGGSNDESIWNLLPTPVGGLLAVGNTSSQDGQISAPRGMQDAWLVSLDDTLGLRWMKNYGGSADDGFFGGAFTSDGGMVLTGWSKSTDGDLTDNQGSWDLWVVKLGPEGVSVPEQPGSFTLTIAPNPANDQLRITWSSATSASLTVHDALGQVVHSQNLSSAPGLLSLPVEAWASGIYTISLQDATGRQSERFVKE